jgi:predicted nucleic acid-binding Zn ribbon protein
VSGERRAGARSRRSPRPLAEAFGALTDELAPRTLLADVQRAWPASVGEAIAAQASVTGERGGVLTVACAASVWAQELDLMAPQIIARLNRELGTRPDPRTGSDPVRRLRCVAVGHGR